MVYCWDKLLIPKQAKRALDGDVDAQTHLVLKNLSAVLEAAGSGLNCRESHCFLKADGRLPEGQRYLCQYFGEHKPARACVEVSCLPKNVDVEIDAIAVIADS